MVFPVPPAALGLKPPGTSTAPTLSLNIPKPGGLTLPTSTATLGGFKPPGTSLGGTGTLGGTLGTGGGFGLLNKPGGLTGISGLGATQQQQQPQMPAIDMIASRYEVFRHGDERDALIARFNYVQAQIGAGTAFYGFAGRQQLDTHPISEDDPEHVFKAIVYNVLPVNKDEDGRVCLQSSRAFQEIKDGEANVLKKLQGIYQNIPGVRVQISTITPLVGQQGTEIIFESVDEKTQKNICASQVFEFIKSAFAAPAAQQAQYAFIINTLKELGCENQYDAQRATFTKQTVFPIVAISKEKLAEYLRTPPKGVDPVQWDQAKKANPDPERIIPVAIYGFGALHRRVEVQELEQSRHEKRLRGLNKETLEQKIVQREVAQEEIKTRFSSLSADLVKLTAGVMALMRKQAMRQPPRAGEELELRSQLDSLQRELNDPTQYKGQLNELRARIGMQDAADEHRRARSMLKPSEDVVNEVAKHLETQQRGIDHLLEILDDDLRCIEIMAAGLETQRGQFSQFSQFSQRY